MQNAAVFGLLDDSGTAAGGGSVAASATDPGAGSAISRSNSPTASRLYTDYAHERVCEDPARLDMVCAEIDADLRAGLHAVVLADYEWGVRLAGLPLGHDAGGGALRCLMFRRMQRLDAGQVEAWLAQQEAAVDADLPATPSSASSHASFSKHDAEASPLAAPASASPLMPTSATLPPPGIAGVLDLRPSIDRDAYNAGIAAIHAALQAGEAYQINYTLRLAFAAYGTPLALYRRLRQRQPVSFGALIALPEGRWVLSCSPELFLAHDAAAQRVLARPMKGTAARVLDPWADPAADRAQAAALAQDPKNRAENLMIVDLLRNDIGRIARTGTVRVPALFSVEGHPALWQMTSTVEAQPGPDVTFADMLRALFPCGSITGAPKHRAMQLIEALEKSPRGLYTGAIGWLDAASTAVSTPASTHSPPRAMPTRRGAACGDFCLSVAIRTLVLDAPGPDGLRAGQLGIGGGIVLDSRAADEYQECLLKARFLTDLDPGLRLFETLYADPAGQVRHLDEHFARLAHSAGRLGFACDAGQLRTALYEAIRSHLAAALAHGSGAAGIRVRIGLAKDGRSEIVCAALAPLPAGPVRLLLAGDLGLPATDARDPLLRFKTTRRADYDAAWQRAERLGAFDALFFNRGGELTEGGRSNVFVKLDGRWWTPPLSSGVLPGVMRAQVLADPHWSAAERRLTRADLQRAEALMVCNALRGTLAAQLESATGAA
jgi:para-aminobenzoate synthetase/4-amino-4-deoxychorismate lyase